MTADIEYGTFRSQLDLFLDITRKFNQISAIPGIYGSLGLFKRLGIENSVKDIDFLIDDNLFSERWPELVEIMTSFGFSQDPTHEHEFIYGTNAVSFFGFNELFKLTKIKKSEIPTKAVRGIEYKLPIEKQFLIIYQTGLKNKWRKVKKEKEDLVKIDLINKRLIGNS